VLAPPPPLLGLAWRALPLGALMLLATIAMLAGFLLTRPGPRPVRRLLTVGVVAVGSGEAAWVRTPSDRFILIGGGPPGAGERVVRSLKAAGAREIALVVQPYPYAEAIGGLPAVLEAFPRCGGSWDAGYPPPRHENQSGIRRIVPARPINEWQEAISDLLNRQSVPVQSARAGQTLDLGDGVRLTVLAPTIPFLDNVPGAPNNSIVLRLTYGKTVFCLRAVWSTWARPPCLPASLPEAGTCRRTGCASPDAARAKRPRPNSCDRFPPFSPS